MGKIMRLENWPSLLADFLADEKPFEWGARDCSLFAADAVFRITGSDPAKSLRGKYKTEKGAARILKRRGGLEKVAAKLAADSGMEEIPPLMAQRGDVVLINTPLGAALGIINLRGEVAGQGAQGIECYPANRALRAWRVG